ncbi:MAG TPA: hypothetical protein VKA02_09270 [Candidatus Acidoferrum sp.]|nr:hypothetical protein [Candidatus Acidoferrum sp.]
MRKAGVFYFLCLCLCVAVAVHAEERVAVRIRQIGLEGIYPQGALPARVSVQIRNLTAQPLSFDLHVSEVALIPELHPVSDAFVIPSQLASGEERLLSIPIHVRYREAAVLFVEALTTSGTPIGYAARRIGPKVDGNLIALICANPALATNIQQKILLSGSPEEQINKSKRLHFVSLSEPPSEFWAYAPASTVILAAPVARFSTRQLEALELYLAGGGKLALVEDQLDDDVTAQLSRGKRASPAAHFLENYRAHLKPATPVDVSSGTLVTLPSVNSGDFSGYFRPLGFTENTPGEIHTQFERFLEQTRQRDFPRYSFWLMKRLGTSFRFPDFFHLLLWVLAYLFIVGLFNFVLLRRLGRPELGWVTLPLIAIAFSVFLFFWSERDRPRTFGVDEMVVYGMDSRSALATAEAQLRISAPARSVVHPRVPGNWVYMSNLPENFQSFDFVNTAFSDPNVRLDSSWETEQRLQRWSYCDLDFRGARRFSGNVSRDPAGSLHNGTGLSFEQALFVNKDGVFVLGKFPAGSSVDLAHAQVLAYREQTGRIVSTPGGYPQPPFAHVGSSREEGWPDFGAHSADFEAEWNSLEKGPFSLLELVHGWSVESDKVFSSTKGIFFGLSREGGLQATLRNLEPQRRSYSLTVVTFGEWP